MCCIREVVRQAHYETPSPTRECHSLCPPHRLLNSQPYGVVELLGGQVSLFAGQRGSHNGTRLFARSATRVVIRLDPVTTLCSSYRYYSSIHVNQCCYLGAGQRIDHTYALNALLDWEAGNLSEVCLNCSAEPFSRYMLSCVRSVITLQYQAATSSIWVPKPQRLARMSSLRLKVLLRVLCEAIKHIFIHRSCSNRKSQADHKSIPARGDEIVRRGTLMPSPRCRSRSCCQSACQP